MQLGLDYKLICVVAGRGRSLDSNGTMLLAKKLENGCKAAVVVIQFCWGATALSSAKVLSKCYCPLAPGVTPTGIIGLSLGFKLDPLTPT